MRSPIAKLSLSNLGSILFVLFASGCAAAESSDDAESDNAAVTSGSDEQVFPPGNYESPMADAFHTLTIHSATKDKVFFSLVAETSSVRSDVSDENARLVRTELKKKSVTVDSNGVGQFEEGACRLKLKFVRADNPNDPGDVGAIAATDENHGCGIAFYGQIIYIRPQPNHLTYVNRAKNAMLSVARGEGRISVTLSAAGRGIVSLEPPMGKVGTYVHTGAECMIQLAIPLGQSPESLHIDQMGSCAPKFRADAAGDFTLLK